MFFAIRRRSQVPLFLARVGRTCTLDRLALILHGRAIARAHAVSQSVRSHNFLFSLAAISAKSPLCCSGFLVYTEPHTGARPSVRLCLGLIV
jgi:hypothetical protein